MKKCGRGRNIGTFLIIFGLGIFLCLIIPPKFLVFLLTFIIIFIGFIIK